MHPKTLQLSPTAISLAAGLLTGLGGCALLFRTYFFTPPNTTFFWADYIDARLIYWIVNWGWHILFERQDPANFWNANSFYPAANTLSASDALISLQIVFAPLRALGFHPLTALYAALAACLVTGSALTAAAVRQLLGFSTLEAVFVTFAALFSLSFSAFLNHYQLFGFAFGPPFFLHCLLYLRDFKTSDLLAACALFILGTGTAMYFAPMSLAVIILAGIPALITAVKQHGGSGSVRRVGWGGLAILAASAGLVYYFLAQPYLERFGRQHDFIPEIAAYSAAPLSILTPYTAFSYWYPQPSNPVPGFWEYACFPGWLLLGLAIAWAIAAAWRLASEAVLTRSRASGRRAFSALSSPALTWPLMLLVLWMLSLGPAVRPLNLPSPLYLGLAKVIPGMLSLRAPGRFGIWLGLPLGIIGVLALRRLRLPTWRAGLAQLILLAALVIESIPQHPIYPVVLDPWGVYSAIAAHTPQGTPLIELPSAGVSQLDTLRRITRQLAGSTYHWGKLVVGYGAVSSPENDRLIALDSSLRQGADAAGLFQFGQGLGVQHYLVYLPAYPASVQAQIRAMTASPGACVIFETGPYLYFTLDCAVPSRLT